jgi:putative peptidoglycan lipid II flippase
LAFGADQFTWEATVLTGKTVAMLAVGLVAEAVIVMLMRAYYALHDTATPVKIALIGLIIDVFVSVVGVFVFGLDVWVLGLSSTIGGVFSAIVMFILLHRRIGGLWSKEFFSPFLRMMAAASVMAISLYIPIKLLDQVVFDTTRTINLLVLTGIAGSCGMMMYLALTRLFQVKEALMVMTYVQGKLRGVQVKEDELKMTETVKVTESNEETK